MWRKPSPISTTNRPRRRNFAAIWNG
jgi:hypothetical protein